MPVFEPEAQFILNCALENASRFGAARIGTDHLLLAIASARDCAAAKHLALQGATFGTISPRLYSGGYNSKLSASDITPSLRCAIEVASALSDKKPINSEILLRALIADRGNSACRILTALGIDLDGLSAMCMSGKTDKQKNLPQSVLKFGRDLSQMAEEGKLDVCACRNDEICAVAKVLCRKSKNNACLVGEAGVGKTAIAEGLAMLLASADVPPALKGKRIFALDIAATVSGAKYRGEFEERLRSVLCELQSRNTVVFIDELHTIVGAGSAEGSIDACGILKPILSRGGLQVIGATTFEEYARHIEKDAALARRFQKITVTEPSPARCRQMLLQLRQSYEAFHKIEISNEAIDSAIALSVRFMPSRRLPDKAIDLMDEAACALRLFGEGDTLLPCHIENAVAERTDIPIERVRGKAQLRAEALKSIIFGQDAVIERVCDTLSAGMSGLSDAARPMGSFIFSGPSGVGKTALAGAVANELFGRDSLIRFDMSEYSQAHTVSRLIGSPPGYVGCDEGGRLVSAVRNKPYSVVLFDEIEKAHPDIYNILLQILDGGVLTDSRGRKADFTNCIVVLTTNANTASKSMGFLQNAKRPAFNGLFLTELVGRFDCILRFSQLGQETLEQICESLLEKIAQRAAAKGVAVCFSSKISKMIAACPNTSSFGVRALKREIEGRICLPLGKAILSGSENISVGTDGESITVLPAIDTVKR